MYLLVARLVVDEQHDMTVALVNGVRILRRDDCPHAVQRHTADAPSVME
jgi:hypothetical protein